MYLGSPGRAEAQGNRNYIIEKMFADIEEIIRVLQLTTYDEDEGDDPINDMRKAASIINNKMDLAHSWLNDPNADAGGLGKSLMAQNKNIQKSKLYNVAPLLRCACYSTHPIYLLGR